MRSNTTIKQIAEEVRDFFYYQGYPLLPRQYTTDHGFWPEGHAGPEWYRDGTEVPVDLRLPAFTWDGNYEGIIDEIDAGSFLVLYVGHGERSGWRTPSFKTSMGHLDSLDNGSYTPVTLSYACLTGWYDNETDDELLYTTVDEESFAEEFL